MKTAPLVLLAAGVGGLLLFRARRARCSVPSGPAVSAAVSAPARPGRPVPLSELYRYNGVLSHPSRICIAVKGVVYDVTAGANFYGPGGAYQMLAGHDASLVLAKRSMDPALLDCSVAGLSEGEQAELDSWEQRLAAKYPTVGHVPDQLRPPPAATSAPIMPSHDHDHAAGAAPGAKCPLGFGSDEPGLVANAPVSGELFSFASLAAQGRGGDGGRLLVSLKGVVFDVSSRGEEFGPGGGMHALAGHDATRALAFGSADVALLNGPLGPDMEFAHHQQLERWAFIFNEFPVVGALEEEARAEILGEQTRGGPVSPVQALVDAGDVDGLVQELEAGGDADSLCVRTRMSALHKAVEMDQPEIVAVLLRFGADRNAKALLYDDDTPQQLAVRLKRGPEMLALFE